MGGTLSEDLSGDPVVSTCTPSSCTHGTAVLLFRSAGSSTCRQLTDNQQQVVGVPVIKAHVVICSPGRGDADTGLGRCTRLLCMQHAAPDGHLPAGRARGSCNLQCRTLAAAAPAGGAPAATRDGYGSSSTDPALDSFKLTGLSGVPE